MAKKKKSKYIILGIVVILAVAVFLNWENIKFMFEMYSSYKDIENEPIYEDEDSDTNFEDKNPILEEIENKKDEIDTKNENDDKKDDDDIEKNNEEKNDIKNSNSTSQDTYIEILNKYNARLESLQSEFQGKLNSLLSQGYSDYKSGNVSKAKLASSYLSKGKNLEKESDAKFNALMKEMESELKSNGLDTSITKNIKSYYNGCKSQKMKEIMAKANKGR